MTRASRSLLVLVALAGARGPRTVARGAPLFWSWSPDGRTLAVHSGQSVDDMSVGGTVTIDAETGHTDSVLSRVVAPYRAPSWSADGRWLAFARLAEHGTRLVLTGENGERCTRDLASGPVAFVWHPRLPILAYVVGRDDSPHVYQRIVCLDLQGERERVIERPAIACAWHPDEPRLFRLAVDPARDALVWEYEDEDAPATTIVRFVPTRDRLRGVLLRPVRRLARGGRARRQHVDGRRAPAGRAREHGAARVRRAHRDARGHSGGRGHHGGVDDVTHTTPSPSAASRLACLHGNDCLRRSRPPEPRR